MIHFGTAGWLYKDWEGIVYPSPKPKGFDPLRYLAGFFTTVEVNSTYYGPASAASATKWIERVEDFPDFRFTAKLWKRFTHERGTAWTRAEVKEVRQAFDKLHEAGRLGAVLLQFPWSFRRIDENREWLDDVTRTFSQYPLVLEVRLESWNIPSFYRLRQYRPAALQEEHQAKRECNELGWIHPRSWTQLQGLVSKRRGSGSPLRLSLFSRRARAMG
jgi:uncharacterized protein YecE (DUF72 family)